ncbi:MAG: formimidoylglutamase [Acidobacteriota bacterium]
MKNFTPPDISLPPASEDDPRIGHLLGRRVDDRNPPKAVVVGFPSDEGVRRAGGQVGASAGPDAIRRQLYPLTPDGQNPGFRELVERVQDVGDLILSGEVEQDQGLLGVAIAPYLKENILVIVLGGGHDATVGHFLGHVHARRNLDVLAWDAHANLRQPINGLAHSQSVFRQILAHPSQCCRQLSVAGLQPHQTSATHLDYISNRNGRYYWKKSLTSQQVDEIYSGADSRLMVSFDLDAVEQSQAPAVSTPNCDGLSASLWLQAARRAGKCPQVASIDVVEFNPALDPDGRTARLAALTVWRFLAGLVERY